MKGKYQFEIVLHHFICLLHAFMLFILVSYSSSWYHALHLGIGCFTHERRVIEPLCQLISEPVAAVAGKFRGN